MKPGSTDQTSAIPARIAAGEHCWLPGLSATLVDDFWSQETPVLRTAYTTSAWLGHAADHEAHPIPGYDTIFLEPLPHNFAARFEAAPDTLAALVPPVFADALRRLEPGGAQSAVATLVRSIHRMGAIGSGYDSSHSEPDIPFSIFVSVPIGELHAGLRLAESLLHEAMHLQLTLIERIAPLTVVNAAMAYSPWQERERPAQGLVHGLYVFAAIHRWLTLVAANERSDQTDRHYADRRLAEIKEELREVSALEQLDGLTPFARKLVAALHRSVNEHRLAAVR